MAAVRGFLVVLASAVLCGGAQIDKEPIKKELDALRGTWKLVDFEVAGKHLTEEATRNKSLAIFDGDRLTRWSESGFFSYTIKIIPDKEPKAIDLLGTEAGKDVTTLGIYEIKGDTLRLCTVHRNGADRPTAFRTSADRASPEYAWAVSVSRRQSKE
jgi:uncharacterized protein (TIGR03067 family)